MLRYIQSVDWKVLEFLNHHLNSLGGFLNKFFATYLIYFIPFFLIGLWFFSAKAKVVAMRAFFSAILAWPILALISGKLINRPRPFMLGSVQELVFHRPDYSFPSDHAAALFAITFSFFFSGYRKIGYLMLIISLIVCAFRVSNGLHFPSDVVAGAVYGLVAAYLVKILDPVLNKLYQIIINIAQKVRLA